MNALKVVVEDARAADVAAISELGYRTFTDAYAEHSEPEDLPIHLEATFSEAAVLQNINDSRVRYLVARADNELGGFAKTLKAEPPDICPSQNVLELVQLYTSTRFYRRGIGEALMNAVKDHARALDCDGVWLSVWQEADWAVRFYEKQGFTPVGPLEFHLGSTVYTDSMMWFSLTG